MKLTKLEQKTLNVQLEITSPLLKPNNCCVVIIHRESNQVWLVKNLQLLGNALKKCRGYMKILKNLNTN